jgi:hypothetical protein
VAAQIAFRLGGVEIRTFPSAIAWTQLPLIAREDGLRRAAWSVGKTETTSAGLNFGVEWVNCAAEPEAVKRRSGSPVR